MKKEGNERGMISRRTFIKGMGAGAGLALAGPLAPRVAYSKVYGNVPAWRIIWTKQSYFQLIDPHVRADSPPHAYKLNMYDQLYRYRDNPPKLISWLAKSYDVSPDGMQWTYHLKPGLLFHDGNEITAEDVRFSVERVMEMGKGVSGIFKKRLVKDSVKVIDKYTCQFNLEKKVVFFHSIIPTLCIVNSKLLRKHEKAGDYGAEWLANNEAGSGAFMLKSYDPATGWVAKKFPKWWGGWNRKHFKEIEFKTIVEQSSRLNSLLKGEVNALDPSFAIPDKIKMLKENPNINVTPVAGLKTFFIRMNTVRPPTNNVHYRKALSYIFPYKQYIESGMQGNAVRSKGGPLPNGMWGWPKDLKGYDTNIEKAKEELAIAKKEMSPEDFNRVPTIKPIKGFPPTMTAALYLQSAASKLGLKMEVRQEPWTILTGKANKPETTHDIWIHWMSAYYIDPDCWIGRPYHSSYHGAFFGSTFYKNEKVEALLDKGKSIVAREERQPIYEEACRLIVEDAPDIWVSNVMFNGIFTRDVHGWKFCSVGSGQELIPMWRE